MVQNIDSLVRRALLGSFLVFCSYSTFAPTSRAVAEDEITGTTNPTSPETADRAARQIVVGFQPAVPQYEVDYSCGFESCGPVFDRWFYVKRALKRLQEHSPLVTDVPLMGDYHILYSANPSYHDARDGGVYAAQGYGVPIAVPLAPQVRYQYNYGHGVPASRLTPISQVPRVRGRNWRRW